jgi:hypothetical protein
MNIPEAAEALLEERYEGSTWTMLHAWTSDETVLAVIAVADDDCFDLEEDAFDVDRIRLEALQIFDTVQEGWAIEEDTAFELGDVFAELVQAFEGGEETPEALRS